MTDEQLRELLLRAGWRVAYEYENGMAEWNGPSDSDWPTLPDIRRLLDAAYRTGRFRLGDHVRKVRGSQWQGRIVGVYSTALTPEGYCVESDAHSGSVQIYPAAALELVTP
jgi:hypothetical protein